MNQRSVNNEVIKQKQVLSMQAIFAVSAVLAALFILTGPVIMNSQDRDRQKSIDKAQSLAYQIVILDEKRDLGTLELSPSQMAQLEESNGRQPASDVTNDSFGTLGMDPWGQAYHYKIRREGHTKVVDVWTTGENAIQTQVLIPVNPI